jgi:4-hydroxy-tetrahydrodipicolinate reductase
MKIGLLGFGKMGKEIIKGLSKKDKVLFILEKDKKISTPKNIARFYDVENISKEDLEKIDILIEFTNPNSAKNIILNLIKKQKNLKILSGTTAWDLNSIKKELKKQKTIFLYESNYSIGINVIFNNILEFAKKLYKNKFKISIEETHHKSKKDKPSGTAKTISNVLNKAKIKHKVKSYRKANVPGTHILKFKIENEELEIKHIAKDRKVFSSGVIASAKKFLKEKKPGIYSFKDLQ